MIHLWHQLTWWLTNQLLVLFTINWKLTREWSCSNLVLTNIMCFMPLLSQLIALETCIKLNETNINLILGIHMVFFKTWVFLAIKSQANPSNSSWPLTKTLIFLQITFLNSRSHIKKGVFTRFVTKLIIKLLDVFLICDLLNKTYKSDSSSSNGHLTFTTNVSFSSYSAPNNSWLLDIEVIPHVASNANNVPKDSIYNGSERVFLGNGNLLSIHCVGHCYLLPTHHKCFPTLRHILHTPHLIHNLLSMDKLCSDTNMYIEFHNDVFFIKDFSKKEILMQGINERDLYKLIGVFSIIITSLTPQALTTSI